MNDIAVPVNQSAGGFLSPRNLTEARELAEMITRSDFVPTEYRGKPDNAIVAIQLGSEVGLGPIQSLQTIAVINGRPQIYGDGLIALVQASPLCELLEEGFDDKSQTAWCKVRRRGRKERVGYFSMEDAKRAQLLGKKGPWTMYPRRMCQMRARSWTLRDEFADVLKGLSRLSIADESGVRDVTPERPVSASENDAPSFDKATGEIIEMNTDESPEDVPDDVAVAIDLVSNLISTAHTPDELKKIKQDILDIPTGYRGDLINQWKTRKNKIEVAVAS